MTGLREHLERRALRFTPNGNAYEAVLRRAARRHAARRIATVMTASAIAVAGFTGLWAVSGSVQRPLGRSSSTPPDAPERPRGLRIAHEAIVDGWVVLPDSFGLWVAGAGKLFDVDLATGRARQTATGDWDYDYVQLAEYGEGTILIASGPKLWQLDARSGSVIDGYDFGQLGYIDAVLQSRSGTWVAASSDPNGVLASIDLDTGKVLDRYMIGQGVHQLDESAGYLFVGSQTYDGSAILRVDPGTREVTPVPAGPGSMAVIGSRVWVASGDQVTCTDAILLTPCGAVSIARATTLASNGDVLWVLSMTGSSDPSIYLPDPDQPATVTLLDGVTGEIMAGPLALPDVTPATIAAFHGHAWIGFHDSGRIVRVDTCDPEKCDG